MIPHTIAVTTPASTAKASTDGIHRHRVEARQILRAEREQQLNAGAREQQAERRPAARRSPGSPPASGAPAVRGWRRSRRGRRARGCVPTRATTSRLATLAHAISSTKATAPISDTIVGRDVADQIVEHRNHVEVQAGGLLDWEVLAEVGRDAVGLSCACSTLTPGLSRPITRNTTLFRLAVSMSIRAAVHISGRALGVDARRQQQLEARRQDADDARAAVAELDVLADDRLIAAEAPQPERVAENRATAGGPAAAA